MKVVSVAPGENTQKIYIVFTYPYNVQRVIAVLDASEAKAEALAESICGGVYVVCMLDAAGTIQPEGLRCYDVHGPSDDLGARQAIRANASRRQVWAHSAHEAKGIMRKRLRQEKRERRAKATNDIMRDGQ